MNYRAGTIILHSRRYVNLFDLKPAEIDMLDIAHALSMKCRFSGHCPKFYSVAQHSVFVSNWLIGQSLATQLAGLLHDAGEAYTPDIAGPVKFNPIFDGVRELENEISNKVHDKFIAPFEPNYSAIDWRLIKAADADLLRTECVSLWGCQPKDWGLNNPVKYSPIDPWRPRDAKLMFEDRYQFLVQGLEAEREARQG